jgi:CheY-like chemotaxis protein
MLVVDDDPAWRALYRMEFEGAFEIREATDGAEALSLVPRLRPDIIVVDLRMPRMDGPTFLKELHRQGVGAKVVIASAMLPEDGRAPIPGARLAPKTPDLREVREAVKDLVPGCFGRPASPSSPPSQPLNQPRWLD